MTCQTVVSRRGVNINDAISTCVLRPPYRTHDWTVSVSDLHTVKVHFTKISFFIKWPCGKYKYSIFSHLEIKKPNWTLG